MELTSFIVMDVLEKAKEMERAGEHVVHLEVGEPDFPLPAEVAEAAARAVRSGQNKYSQSMGIPELREAISQYYLSNYGVEVEPERIFVTPGSSPALLAAIKIFADEKGERVAYTDPGYPCYKNMVRFLGLKEVPVKVFEENFFKPTPGELKGFDVMVINSPSNPTGAVYSPSELEDLVKRAEDENFLIISDEIYHGISYGDRDHTILEFTDRAIVINGFSKFFAATGWRLGWIVVPRDKVRLMQCVAQNLFICAPTPLQYGALSFFEEAVVDKCRGYVREYKKRRDYLLSELKRLGFHINYEPMGAFYIFADISGFGTDGFSFSMRALSEAKVAITPGVDFGSNMTQRYVRFSYANSLENIKTAVERLSEWLKRS
ncbi:MAG: pyridoxal phosphate-dependent aminotransferase [Deferribacteres bacterium]|nr:pyridoxal phosphate-dependent aminotransferase [Deferribacteres bacterium]